MPVVRTHKFSLITRIGRIVVAAICAPLAGYAIAHTTHAAEDGIRLFLNKPALVDDASLRAEAIVGPLILPAFVFMCWAYVLPVVYLARRLGSLIAAGMTAIPIWYVALVLLHIPGFDPLWASIAATGVVVALPVFGAALSAAIIIGSQPPFEGGATPRDEPPC